MLLPTSSAPEREKLAEEQLQLLSSQLFSLRGWGDCPKPGSPGASRLSCGLPDRGSTAATAPPASF